MNTFMDQWFQLFMPKTLNTDAFSHGQVASKLWLCEELEPYLDRGFNVHILGGWHNVLGFMLMCRRPDHYNLIQNIDIDPSAIQGANLVTNAWIYDRGPVVNTVGDSALAEIDHYDPCVVINCSVEHMSMDWFHKLPPGTLICVQSSNMTDPLFPWLITTPSPNIEAFLNRFLPDHSTPLFIGERTFRYPSLTYSRYMLITRT